MNSRTVFADIHVPGLVGSITLTQENSMYPATIRSILQPLTNNHKFGWEVHQMPTLWGYSDDSYCTQSVQKSSLLHNLTERHGLIYNRALYSDEFITLYSIKESIVGMTLVIIDPKIGPISCSTILPLNEDKTVLKAKFQQYIGGEIYFLPYFNPIKQRTLILGELYKVDGIATIVGHDWYIGSKIFTNINDNCMNEGKDDKIFDVRDMESQKTCNWLDGSGCIMGDMTAKHGPLFPGVSIDFSLARPFALRDPYLAVGGEINISWHAIYIRDKIGNLLSCSIIKPTQERKFNAVLRKRVLQDTQIFGIVHFIQLTPYHSTFTKIVVKGHPELSSHPFPPTFTVFDMIPKGEGCDSIGTIMFTKNKRIKLLLSPGQFSEYTNNSFHQGVLDVGCVSTFTLFGPKSILGKTVAVFTEFTPNHQPQQCGQIIPSKVDETEILFANFAESGKISGNVMMVQFLLNSKNMDLSDTLILIDLVNQDRLVEHKYHIHVSPPLLSINPQNQGFDCNTTGPHYNPFNVSIEKPMYEYECSPNFPLRCEVGDLEGKHGFLEIGRDRKQFVDSNLNLFGPTSGYFVFYIVRGKSLVIHGEGKQKTMIDCAKLETFKT